MNKFLQILVLVLAYSLISCQSDDIVNNEAIVKTKAVLIAVESGKSVKVAKNCKINIKETLRSLKTLDNDVERDLEVHILYHKGIVLNDCEILNKEKADLILQRWDENTHIIQYRYLSSSFDAEYDDFMGHNISVLFKTGPDANSYGCGLSLTFGRCEFCNREEDKGLEPMNTPTNNSLSDVFEILCKSHKALLEAKINAAETAAKEYATYNALYKEAISKKSFAEQIPELESKISEKKAECSNHEKNLQTARAALDGERQNHSKNSDEINKCSNEINSLNSQRQALEQEQVNRRNAATGHAAREKELNDAKATIQNVINVIKEIIPHIFEGINCFNAEGELTQQCIDIVNRIV